MRFLDGMVAIYFLSAVYASKAYQDRTSFAHLLDRKHMLNGPNANVYALCSFIVFLDVQVLAYLPWLNSPFSRMSKGFPNMVVFRAVSWTTLVTSLAFIGLQIPFLLNFDGPMLKKGFSGLSVALNCAKFFFALVTYFLKASSLAGTSTTPDLEELKQWEHRKPKDDDDTNPAWNKNKEGVEDRHLARGNKFFFNEEYSRESRASGLIAPTPDAAGDAETNEIQYTMNPLRRMSERVVESHREDHVDHPPPESLTINPLHRPEVEELDAAADNDDDDDEYTSMTYTSNPMLPSQMAIPSIKDKDKNLHGQQNDKSNKDGNNNDNENDNDNDCKICI